MSKKDKFSGASPRDDNGTEKKNVQSGPCDMGISSKLFLDKFNA